MGRIIDTDDYAFVLIVPRGDVKLPCPNPDACETDHATADADKIGIDDQGIDEFFDPNVRAIDVLGALLALANRLLEDGPFSAALVPDLLGGYTEVSPSGTRTRGGPAEQLGANPLFGTPTPRPSTEGGHKPPWQR